MYLKEKYLTRYPDDPYDRMWKAWSYNPLFWAEVTTTSSIQNFDSDLFDVPSAVLQTAVTPVNSSELKFYWDTDPLTKDPGYLGNLHFSELLNLAKNEKREFYITLNNAMWDKPFSPDYLYSDATYSVMPKRGSKQYNVMLIANANSTLPPILNAFELFIAMSVSDIPTDSGDGKVLSFLTNSISIF
jgi:Malectin-like domain